ncbi:HDOD domain-containing protein [Thermosulfurimonas dismutans]|uniref:HD domain protein n=1 Tax=Thermosulfurimonas dismutans TaxID=999894 RepID=A0A179D608_9BACT|nr:HDOD domain-containing protein [Thermosulfurimonas dismutans]OAQ21487.1 HD domain protein [Thermosulfurimonas dismutans]
MLGWFKKVQQYAVLLTGDFEKIFKDFSPPPLPQIITRILEKLSDPEVSPIEIAPLIEKDPALSSQVLKLANSAYYGLQRKISRISEAASLLGLKEIETLVLSYGVVRALEDPEVEGFDLKIFWEDSLFRALFAREVAQRLSLEAEEAFAGALLEDVALPVLLTNWYEGYRKVYERWQSDRSLALHEVEKEVLSWNHAQAGAWVLKNWKLPDVLVCCVGLHVKPLVEISEVGFLKSPVGVVALASLLPSVSRPENVKPIMENAPLLGLSLEEVAAIAEEVLESFEEFAACLGLDIKPPVEVVRNLNG